MENISERRHSIKSKKKHPIEMGDLSSYVAINCSNIEIGICAPVYLSHRLLYRLSYTTAGFPKTATK